MSGETTCRNDIGAEWVAPADERSSENRHPAAALVEGYTLFVTKGPAFRRGPEVHGWCYEAHLHPEA